MTPHEQQKNADDDGDVGDVEDGPPGHVDEVDDVSADDTIHDVPEGPRNDERERYAMTGRPRRNGDEHDGDQSEDGENAGRHRDADPPEEIEGDVVVPNVPQLEHPGCERNRARERRLGGKLRCVVAPNETEREKKKEDVASAGDHASATRPEELSFPPFRSAP
jgi:hypothetical protein